MTYNIYFGIIGGMTLTFRQHIFGINLYKIHMYMYVDVYTKSIYVSVAHANGSATM